MKRAESTKVHNHNGAYQNYGAADQLIYYDESQIRTPWFTYTMFLANIGVFIWTISENGWRFEDPDINPMFGPSLDTLNKCGAKDVAKIQSGEVWRLISSCFLHAGILHLGINMIALLALMLPLEQDFGMIKVSLIYLTSGISSTICSSLFLPTRLSVGASGAIFGIFGSNWSILLQNWSHLNNKCRMTCFLVLLTGFNLALGLLPFVDNFAHIGGFICGFFLGMILVIPNSQYRSGKNCQQQACLWVGVTVTGLGLAAGLLVLISGHDLTGWCE